MAAGAVDALMHRGLAPSAGLVVSETGSPEIISGLRHVRGDHPVPGEKSSAAAAAVLSVTDLRAGTGDAVVLISGGTTSLIAAPVPGLTGDDLSHTFEVLLGSGAPIEVMNLLRRRLLQWGGGRLTSALSPQRVHCLIVSDVMGGAFAAIGSGPCIPDPATTDDVAHALERWPLGNLREGVRKQLLALSTAARSPATARIILDNRTAVRAAEQALAAAGIKVVPSPVATLEGAADVAGRELALRLRSLGAGEGFVTGGETTVELGGSDAPPGGRCQELALAAAEHLQGARGTLLAAGTDGRDGPTNAAGAIVDSWTWSAIGQTGRDPRADLAAHRSHDALAAARALLVASPTGTNVNDLVIAVG